MNKTLLVYLILCSFNLNSQSQTDRSSFLNKTELKCGYYGMLLFENGLNIGAEYLWKEKSKTKIKKGKEKVTKRQLLLNGSIGYATNFTNQTENGLSTYYGFIWRRSYSNGRQFNIEVNPLGYYRSFLPETFEVKDAVVSRVKFPGRNYYAPSFAIGYGKHRKNKRRSGWYVNLNISFRMPHNTAFLPHISLQYGQRFTLKKKIK